MGFEVCACRCEGLEGLERSFAGKLLLSSMYSSFPALLPPASASDPLRRQPSSLVPHDPSRPPQVKKEKLLDFENLQPAPKAPGPGQEPMFVASRIVVANIVAIYP